MGIITHGIDYLHSIGLSHLRINQRVSVVGDKHHFKQVRPKFTNIEPWRIPIYCTLHANSRFVRRSHSAVFLSAQFQISRRIYITKSAIMSFSMDFRFVCDLCVPMILTTRHASLYLCADCTSKTCFFILFWMNAFHLCDEYKYNIICFCQFLSIGWFSHGACNQVLALYLSHFVDLIR